MANQEHLSIVKRGVRKWNEWRSNVPNLVPDLSDANLSETTLRKINFTSCDLQHIRLRYAGLKWADFSHSDLSGADLLGADLRQAVMSNAKLVGADLSHATLDHASLNGANLKGAILDNCSLIRTNLADAILTNAVLTDSELNHAIVSSEQLEDVIIRAKHLLMLNMDEVFETPQFEHSINFPPGFVQAGISLLAYFGTIIRRRFPEEDVSVSIKQEGLNVSLVVEPEGASQEELEKYSLNEIEQTFDDWARVLRGELPVNEFAVDEREVHEIRNELRITLVRIESYKELVNMKNQQIEQLQQQIEQLLATTTELTQGPIAPQQHIEIRNEVNQSLNVDITQYVSAMKGPVNELLEKLNDYPEVAHKLEQLKKDVSQIENCNTEKTLKESPSLSRIRRVIESLSDSSTRLGKALTNVKDGVRIAQDLAKLYNSIAQWCGLPTVPKPLLRNNHEE